jgi:acetyl esterase/lipase
MSKACVWQDTTDSACQVHIEKDLSYLGPDRAEKFDLYTPARPPAGQRFPGIVIIHGGGWWTGDKAKNREQNIGSTLTANGYVCISINYILATRDKPSWPGNLYDCKRAVQFLRKNADTYNVDPNNIGVIGGSAGGHLAAMVALTGPKDNLEPPGPYAGISSAVQAAVPMYGIHNLMTFEDTKDAGQQMLGVSRQRDPNLWQSASPVNYIDTNDPPFLILHGTADKTVPVAQSVELYNKLKEYGVSSRLVIVEGAPHTFDLQPIQKDLRPIVISFFDEHLK